MSLAGNDGVIWVRGSGDKLYQQTVGTNYSPITITSAQGTTPQLMFTGNPGYIITELGIQVDPTCTIAAAGMVNLFFTDSSFGIFFNIRWYLPQNVAGPNVPTNTRVTNGPGFWWNNKTANSSVSVATDVALTAGSVRFFARYTLTSIVG